MHESVGMRDHFGQVGGEHTELHLPGFGRGVHRAVDETARDAPARVVAQVVERLLELGDGLVGLALDVVVRLLVAGLAHGVAGAGAGDWGAGAAPGCTRALSWPISSLSLASMAAIWASISF